MEEMFIPAILFVAIPGTVLFCGWISLRVSKHVQRPYLWFAIQANIVTSTVGYLLGVDTLLGAIGLFISYALVAVIGGVFLLKEASRRRWRSCLLAVTFFITSYFTGIAGLMLRHEQFHHELEEQGPPEPAPRLDTNLLLRPQAVSE